MALSGSIVGRKRTKGPDDVEKKAGHLLFIATYCPATIMEDL